MSYFWLEQHVRNELALQRRLAAHRRAASAVMAIARRESLAGTGAHAALLLRVPDAA